MAHWSLREKLQPSLLDRLTDEETDKSSEAAFRQVISEKQFKEAVIRDLAWLLNSVSMDVTHDLDAYPYVRHSVLNYGVPDLTGHTSSNIKVKELANAVKEAIIEYEPRIMRDSLKVRVRTSYMEMSHNSLVFEIQGSVFGQPVPFSVLLRSQLDLESGEFSVKEQRR